MELGMIGLGRMGGNMVQRLLAAGHRVVAYDANKDAIAASQTQGAFGTHALEEMVSALTPPRPVWLMLPQGQPTEDTMDRLSPLLDAGDVILDGGNANYKDTLRRAENLATRGIDLVDDPQVVPEGYEREVVWDGLSLIDYCIAPHYRSDMEESPLIEEAVQYFIDNKMLFKALRDGQVIVVD